MITVVGHDGHDYGARDVRQIDLHAGGVDGTVAALDISQHLAADGPVRADVIDGPFTVGGNIVDDIEIQELRGEIYCEYMRNLTVTGPVVLPPPPEGPSVTVNGNYYDQMRILGGDVVSVVIDCVLANSALVEVAGDVYSLTFNNDIYGDVVIGGNLTNGAFGHLDSDQCTGAVYIGGDLAGPLGVAGTLVGPMTIGGSLKGTLSTGWQLIQSVDIAGHVTGFILIGSSSSEFAVIRVGGDFDGGFETGTSMDSRLVIEGDLGGSLSFGDYAGPQFWHKGTVHINGDMSGWMAIHGYLYDGGGDVSGGHIAIDGSFTSTASILMKGGLAGDTEFIAVDYDGYHPADSWEAGALMIIGGNVYAGNTPADHVWEITCEKGDMNNDGTVNGLDIDPFVMVVTDPNDPNEYNNAYPGLLGSVLYHTDCNCDGSINGLDIDAFVLRLSDPGKYYSSYPGCEECPGRAGGGSDAAGSDPEHVAALFEQYVTQERLPTLIELVRDLVEYFGDTPRGEFWAAVLDELE